MSYPPMFLSDKNLSSKSPNTHPQPHPLQAPQPLFQKRNFFNSPNDHRPESAKPEDMPSSKSKRKQSRPITANKNQIISRRIKITPQPKSIEGPYLSRLKPRHIPMDKERLYEQNMVLKQQNNKINSEMIRVKTKVNQLQKELLKKTEEFQQIRQPTDKISSATLKKIHIVTSLKNAIKDLRQELRQKEQENIELKKNLKSSRIQQKNVQINAYVDECTRLRHHLEEMMRQKDPTNIQNQNQEEKAYQQTILINNLRRQSNQASVALEKSRKQTAKWKQKFFEIEKKKKVIKKTENSQQKNEIQKLKIQVENLGNQKKAIESSLQEENQRLKQDLLRLQRNCSRFEQEVKSREKQISSLKQIMRVQEKQEKPKQTMEILQKLENPPKLFKKIHEIITQKNIMIGVFLSLMDKNHNGIIEQQEFIRSMEINGKTVHLRQIQQALLLISGKSSGPVRLKQLQEYFQKYEYLENAYSSSSSENQPKHHQKLNLSEIEEKKIHQTLKFNDTPLKKQAVPRKEQKKSLKNIPCIQYTQVKYFLDHIFFRMQLNRINLNNIMQALLAQDFRSEKILNKIQLQKILSEAPFAFKNENTEKLSIFLLQDQNKPKFSEDQLENLTSSVTKIQQKLQYFLEPWEVFNTEDEEQFDREIQQILSSCSEELYSHCSALDENGIGVINLHTFQAITQKLKIFFPKQVFQYMLLLFYSHKYELNKVPYQRFIQAYSNMQDDEIDSQERAKLVREQLDIMAKTMISIKKSPKELFAYTQNGRIYPKEFIQCLNMLKICPQDEQVLQLMIESLRYQYQQEIFILLQELQDILIHYGVPKSFDKQDLSQSKPSGEEGVSVENEMSDLLTPNQDLLQQSESPLIQPEYPTYEEQSDKSPFQTIGKTQNLTIEKIEEKPAEPIDQMSDQYNQEYDEVFERLEQQIPVQTNEGQIRKQSTGGYQSSDTEFQQDKEGGFIQNLPVLESVKIQEKLQEKQKSVSNSDYYSKSCSSQTITQNLVFEQNLGVKDQSSSSQSQEFQQAQVQVELPQKFSSNLQATTPKVDQNSSQSIQVSVDRQNSVSSSSQSSKKYKAIIQNNETQHPIENLAIESAPVDYQNSFQSQKIEQNSEIQSSPIANQGFGQPVKSQQNSDSSSSSIEIQMQNQALTPKQELFSSQRQSQRKSIEVQPQPRGSSERRQSQKINIPIKKQENSSGSSSGYSSRSFSPIEVQGAKIEKKPSLTPKSSSSISQPDQAQRSKKVKIESSSQFEQSVKPNENEGQVLQQSSRNSSSPKQRSQSPKYEEEFYQDSSSDISF